MRAWPPRRLATSPRESPPTARPRPRCLSSTPRRNPKSRWRSVPEGRRAGPSFGVFTYNLLRRLNENPDLTYRTLHQAVIDDIKRGNLMATQTPELEGELLDEPVLRLTRPPGLRQWQTLVRQAAGRRIARRLSAAPWWRSTKTRPTRRQGGCPWRGRGCRRHQSRSRRSSIPARPLNDDGTCPTAPDDDAFRKGRFARVVEPGVDLSVVLSEPVRVDPDDGHDYGAAIAALDSGGSAEGLSARVRSSPERLRHRGRTDRRQARLLDRQAAIDRDGPGSSPRLTLPDNPEAATATIASAITRIVKVMALQRLAGVGAKRSSGRSAKSPHDQAATAGSRSRRRLPAGSRELTTSRLRPTIRTRVRRLRHPVGRAWSNAGKKPIDVTILLVGADFSITPMWPTDGADNRIATRRGQDRRPSCRMGPIRSRRASSGWSSSTVPGVRQVAHGLRQSRAGRPARGARRGRDAWHGRRARRCWPSGSPRCRVARQPHRRARRGDVGGGEAVLRRERRGRLMLRACQTIGFRSNGTPRVPHADPVVKGDRSGMGRAVGNACFLPAYSQEQSIRGQRSMKKMIIAAALLGRQPDRRRDGGPGKAGPDAWRSRPKAA